MAIFQPGTLLLCTKDVIVYNRPECLVGTFTAVKPLDYVLFLEFTLYRHLPSEWADKWLDDNTMYNQRYNFTASAKVLAKEQVMYICGVRNSWFFKALNEGQDYKSWSPKATNTIFQQVSTNLKVYFEQVVHI